MAIKCGYILVQGRISVKIDDVDCFLTNTNIISHLCSNSLVSETTTLMMSQNERGIYKLQIFNCKRKISILIDGDGVWPVFIGDTFQFILYTLQRFHTAIVYQ